MLKPMGDENWNGVPLEECPAVADCFAEGIDRLEVVKYSDGRWSRVATDFALILPRTAIPAELLGVRVVRPPQGPGPRLVS